MLLLQIRQDLACFHETAKLPWTSAIADMEHEAVRLASKCFGVFFAVPSWTGWVFLPICLRLAKPIVTMFPKTSASGKFLFISHKPPRRANCFKWRTYGTTTPSDHLDLAFEWRQRILEKSWLPHYMKMLVSIATCQRAAFEPTNFWLHVSTGRRVTWISVTQQVVFFFNEKW